MQIAGKRALVLGGSAGIGLATARSLVDGGATVFAASRNATKRERARTALGEQATLLDLDARDRETLVGTFREIAPLDILVCTATGGDRAIGPFLEMDLDGFQGSFDKLWGYANAVRLGAEHLSEEASIVLVTGYPARKAGPGQCALASVGSAVEGLVRAIAPELAPRRINAVSPGMVATEMFADDPDESARILAGPTKSNPVPRPGTSKEIAQAILFLIANDFVTGTVVDVDGGASLP